MRRSAILGSLLAMAAVAPPALQQAPLTAAGQLQPPAGKKGDAAVVPAQAPNVANVARKIVRGYMTSLREPIWVGYLRDSGYAARPTSRRGRFRG